MDEKKVKEKSLKEFFGLGKAKLGENIGFGTTYYFTIFFLIVMLIKFYFTKINFKLIL